MPIWKLEPVDPDEHHWRASRYKGWVIVRAPDEVKARSLANRAFDGFVQVTPGAETPLMPWMQDRITTCARVDESEYDEEGEEAILAPQEALARMLPRTGNK